MTAAPTIDHLSPRERATIYLGESRDPQWIARTIGTTETAVRDVARQLGLPRARGKARAIAQRLRADGDETGEHAGPMPGAPWPVDELEGQPDTAEATTLTGCPDDCDGCSCHLGNSAPCGHCVEHACPDHPAGCDRDGGPLCRAAVHHHRCETRLQLLADGIGPLTSATTPLQEDTAMTSTIPADLDREVDWQDQHEGPAAATVLEETRAAHDVADQAQRLDDLTRTGPDPADAALLEDAAAILQLLDSAAPGGPAATLTLPLARITDGVDGNVIVIAEAVVEVELDRDGVLRAIADGGRGIVERGLRATVTRRLTPDGEQVVRHLAALLPAGGAQ